MIVITTIRIKNDQISKIVRQHVRLSGRKVRISKMNILKMIFPAGSPEESILQGFNRIPGIRLAVKKEQYTFFLHLYQLGLVFCSSPRVAIANNDNPATPSSGIAPRIFESEDHLKIYSVLLLALFQQAAASFVDQQAGPTRLMRARQDHWEQPICRFDGLQ